MHQLWYQQDRLYSHDVKAWNLSNHGGLQEGCSLMMKTLDGQLQLIVVGQLAWCPSLHVDALVQCLDYGLSDLLSREHALKG